MKGYCGSFGFSVFTCREPEPQFLRQLAFIHSHVELSVSRPHFHSRSFTFLPLPSVYATLSLGLLQSLSPPLSTPPFLLNASHHCKMHHTTNASMTGNMVDPGLLDKIDKLFACGVGEYIPLPQLVVVGDQSR
jgi:hypothetical protein